MLLATVLGAEVRMPLDMVRLDRGLAVAPRLPLSSSRGHRALLLTDSGTLLSGPPQLLEALSERERELVLGHGRRRVINRGRTLFSQGATPEGFYLIETGRIRVFYNAPS